MAMSAFSKSDLLNERPKTGRNLPDRFWIGALWKNARNFVGGSGLSAFPTEIKKAAIVVCSSTRLSDSSIVEKGSEGWHPCNWKRTG